MKPLPLESIRASMDRSRRTRSQWTAADFPSGAGNLCNRQAQIRARQIQTCQIRACQIQTCQMRSKRAAETSSLLSERAFCTSRHPLNLYTEF